MNNMKKITKIAIGASISILAIITIGIITTKINKAITENLEIINFDEPSDNVQHNGRS
jgi:hypothetical protein